MSNSVNLSLDITKTGIQNPLIKVRQGDGGFETLHTTVTANGEPMDLQGWTITFMGTTAGNHKIVDTNVKMVEAPNGIFDYTPSKAWGMDVGEFKVAYFKFVKGDGSASSANFRVNVIEAVDLTQEEAQNYISVVDATIADVNNRLNAASNNLTTLGNRINDYNSKLAALQVGGRNLFLNSKDFNNSSWSFPNEASKSDMSNGFTKISRTSDGVMVAYNKGAGISKENLLVNTPYVWSFFASNTGSTDVTISLNSGAVNQLPSTRVVIPANTSDKRYSFPFTFWTTGGNPDIGLSATNVTDGEIALYAHKLEKGNVATDWTPAPEDVPMGLVVGGRNYLPNSSGDTLSGWRIDSRVVWSVVSDATRGSVFTSTPNVTWTGGGTNALVKILNNQTTGEPVTVSFWAKASVDGANFHSEPQGGANSFNTRLTTSWARYSYTISSFSGTIYFMGVDAGTTYYLDDIKLEIGNVPTDWTPAPEDATIPMNLLYNTNFENNADGWVDRTASTPAKMQVIADGYENYLKVTVVTAWQGKEQYVPVSYSNTTGTFNVSADVYGFINENLPVYVYAADANKTMIGSATFVGSASFAQWRHISKDFTVPQNTKYVVFSIQSAVANGIIGVKNPQITAGEGEKPFIRGSEMQAVPDDTQLVHKTGNETIAGDKTFTGKIGFSGTVANPVVSRTVSGTNGMSFKFRRTGNAVHVEISGNYTGTNWTSSTAPSYAAELFNVVVPAGFAPEDWSQSAIIEYGSAVGFGRYGYDSSSRKMTFTYRGMVGGVGSSKWIVSSVTYTTSDALPG